MELDYPIYFKPPDLLQIGHNMEPANKEKQKSWFFKDTNE